MRTHPLLAAVVGLGLLAGCADGAPTTEGRQAPGAESEAARREAALRTLEAGGTLEEVEEAVATLAAAPEVDGAGIERVGRAARQSADASAQVAAIRVMGRWMSAEPLVRDRIARDLLVTAAGPHEDEVRGMAVQAIAVLPEGAWADDVVASLGQVIRSDGTAQNREIAALALGHVRGANAEAALDALVAAYGRESDLSTRRAMLLNVVEAAGPRASGVLASLPETSPVARRDIADYREILAGGETAIGEIWDRKLARDIERNNVIGTEKGATHVD